MKKLPLKSSTKKENDFINRSQSGCNDSHSVLIFCHKYLRCDLWPPEDGVTVLLS